jgi:hypothetical protein
MATPAIIWRNPKAVGRRRLWNRARRDGNTSLFIVVRSVNRDSEWEGLPSLEMLDGGRQDTRRRENRLAQSRG